MKSYDYEAVAYDGECYCTTCVPKKAHKSEVHPIFASEEMDRYPVCDVCGAVHDYVTLTAEGHKYESASLVKKAEKLRADAADLEESAERILGGALPDPEGDRKEALEDALRGLLEIVERTHVAEMNARDFEVVQAAHLAL